MVTVAENKKVNRYREPAMTVICEQCGEEADVVEINLGLNSVWDYHIQCTECGADYYI